MVPIDQDRQQLSHVIHTSELARLAAQVGVDDTPIDESLDDGAHSLS